MAKYSGPKCKLCRRAGEKLFLRGERCESSKCAMVKRNYPPGMHGQKGQVRLTEFGTQLKEKQKAKKIYGLQERILHNYYLKAANSKGNNAELMLQLLELRIDNLIYRAGFAPSRAKARQLVNHGHFLIKGRRVNIPSYQVKINEIISVSEKKLATTNFQTVLKTIEKKEIPQWLKVDKQKLSCQLIAKPTLEDIKPPFALNQIIEFYSR